MNSIEARTHLAKVFDEDGIKGLQALASKMGIKWGTVYGWLRRSNIPDWRLQAFAKAAKSKRKAA